MVYSSISSFLAPVDISLCLYTSSIMMPVSLFILSNTISQITSFERMREVVVLYVLGVKIVTSFLGITTSILSHIVGIFQPQKLTSWILMIMGILSSFGAMMSISTIFFKSNWSNHIEAMRHVMFLVAEIILMATSMILSIRLALRFKSSTIHYVRQFPDSYIRITGMLLASLLFLGSITALAGFVIGIYVNTQILRENTVTGGGLYSGFLGILISIGFIFSNKTCSTNIRKISLQLILILGILCIISSVTSYLTESMELTETIKYIRENKQIFNDYISYKILLLCKSTLIQLSSLFMIIFTSPLLVSSYTLILNIQESHNNFHFDSSLSNGPDINYPNINRYNNINNTNTLCNNTMLSDTNNINCIQENDLLYKPRLNIDSIEMSAMTHTTSGIMGE